MQMIVKVYNSDDVEVASFIARTHKIINSIMNNYKGCYAVHEDIGRTLIEEE